MCSRSAYLVLDFSEEENLSLSAGHRQPQGVPPGIRAAPGAARPRRHEEGTQGCAEAEPGTRMIHQQCDVNSREIRGVKGTHYRMVLRIS